jgi:hypothetical protein
VKNNIKIILGICVIFLWGAAGLAQNYLISIFNEQDNPIQLSVVEDSTDCQALLANAVALKESFKDQEAYDAFRGYIESCAHVSTSWQIFQQVGGMNGGRSTDLHRFEEYREWLKQVLYYSLDTNFYCGDVKEILGTFSWFNDSRGKDYKGNLAVMYFIINSSRCPRSTAYLKAVLKPTWDELYFIWQDSVKDSTLTPFDSTLPSLEDLGLGILRGQPGDVKNFLGSKYGPMLSNIHASENPFSSETKISFTSREPAAIKFEIFDVLGKRFYTTEKVYSEGENILSISGNDLPHGLLYGRFSTSDGGVKTIKLRHE